MDKLGELNLVNRRMTKAEGEWAYLTRNVWAQQLDRHKNLARDAEGAIEPRSSS